VIGAAQQSFVFFALMAGLVLALSPVFAIASHRWKPELFVDETYAGTATVFSITGVLVCLGLWVVVLWVLGITWLVSHIWGVLFG
jgi:hypothetical protein